MTNTRIRSKRKIEQLVVLPKCLHPSKSGGGVERKLHSPQPRSFFQLVVWLAWFGCGRPPLCSFPLTNSQCTSTTRYKVELSAYDVIGPPLTQSKPAQAPKCTACTSVEGHIQWSPPLFSDNQRFRRWLSDCGRPCSCSPAMMATTCHGGSKSQS